MRLTVRLLGTEILHICTDHSCGPDAEAEELARRNDHRHPCRVHAEPGRPALGRDAHPGPMTSLEVTGHA